MPEKKNGYDIVIIGSGPGGYTAAFHAARLGSKALVIEAGDLGGTCLNRGCIPTKTLLASAGALLDVKRAEELGIKAGSPEIDYPKIAERKDKTVRQLSGGLGMLMKSWGVDVLKGRATFTGGHSLEVDCGGETVEVECEKIVIATGSIPSSIPGVEVNGKSVIDSNHLLELKSLLLSLMRRAELQRRKRQKHSIKSGKNIFWV